MPLVWVTGTVAPPETPALSRTSNSFGKHPEELAAAYEA
ncbi:hypothetical protein SAMN05421837_1011365 [Amycolatopsis pretoriensis]|uniref:Uncharacterized protein n=1 Tax=Amycolatopsis pretoriensis TaxID=218821 RepID=A0A1H5Q8Y9_9PSEU|nr:hypothetical protein SAMN05421837_1011365 [Amycolatopsis pretoriensis]